MTEHFLIFLGVQVIFLCWQPRSVAGLESMKKKPQLLPADNAEVPGAIARAKHFLEFEFSSMRGQTNIIGWKNHPDHHQQFKYAFFRIVEAVPQMQSKSQHSTKHGQMDRQLCFYPIPLLCCKNSKSQSCESLHSAFLERFMAQQEENFLVHKQRFPRQGKVGCMIQ